MEAVGAGIGGGGAAAGRRHVGPGRHEPPREADGERVVRPARPPQLRHARRHPLQPLPDHRKLRFGQGLGRVQRRAQGEIITQKYLPYQLSDSI